ncbi:MAG: PucR family transcriptional regulator ligand-binding domain-containing protein [Thermoleophilaceae bacterium]
MKEGDKQPLRLKELLEQEEFGLRLVTRDEGLLDREIVGAHAVDAPHPSRWLDEGWVHLSSGMSLRSEADERALARELVDCQVAALGFTVNLYFEQVPSALVDEANELGLPIFAVPLDVEFKKIIAFIAESRLSREMFTLRRAFSIQRYLTEALQTTEPEGVLVERLAGVLQGSVVVLDATGQAIASRGGLSARRVREEVWKRPAELQRFAMDGWAVVSTPVDVDGELVSWMVVGTHNKRVFDRLAKNVVEVAANLLAVIGMSHRASVAEERAMKGALLQELLGGAFTEPELARMQRRLATYGFAEAGMRHGAIVRPLRDEEDVLSRLERELERIAVARRAPTLMLRQDGQLVILIEVSGDVKGELLQIRRELDPEGIGTVIGHGRVVDGSTSVADSVKDAHLALAARTVDADPVVGVDDLDLVGLSLGLEGIDSLVSRADMLLAPLDESDHLMETLTSYFETGLDVSKTAKRLQLHPNSVRYRLGQVEDMLGVRLSRPSGISNLYLALQLRQLGGPELRDRVTRSRPANAPR